MPIRSTRLSLFPSPSGVTVQRSCDSHTDRMPGQLDDIGGKPFLIVPTARDFALRRAAPPPAGFELQLASRGAGSDFRLHGIKQSPIQTRRGTNIVAEVQLPKTRWRRCETMIFVLSSFIRLSEPISCGTVTGQRNSTTRLRVSCPTLS